MTNEEVLSRAGVGDLQDIVTDRWRRFIGHILRLPMSRPASLVVDWITEGGKRRLGRPKRTWRDTFKKDMQTMGISGSDTHQARVLPVIVSDGDSSSPNVPAGTRGPSLSSLVKPHYTENNHPLLAPWPLGAFVSSISGAPNNSFL